MIVENFSKVDALYEELMAAQYDNNDIAQVKSDRDDCRHDRLELIAFCRKLKDYVVHRPHCQLRSHAIEKLKYECTCKLAEILE